MSLITDDGWFTFPQAVKDPGPLNRWHHFGSKKTAMTVIAHHSKEGYASLASKPIGYSVLRDGGRFPTAYHWEVIRGNYIWDGIHYPPGTVLQHYPVDYLLQHGHSANDKGPGGESEDFGIPGNYLRLTPAQEESWLLIHKAIEEYTGKTYIRVPGSRIGLVEHREMTIPPGGTACPSNLYDELFARILRGDDDMSEVEKEMIWRMSDILVGEPPANSSNAHGDRIKLLRSRWDKHASFDLALERQNAALLEVRKTLESIKPGMFGAKIDFDAMREHLIKIANLLETVDENT